MNVSNKVRNKNRRRLVLLILVFLMPMIVAWFVLKNIDTLMPSGSRNFGELIQPALPLQDFDLQNIDGTKFSLNEIKGKWSIFYFANSECSELCQTTLSKIHQARLGQGKEMHRLRHFYVNVDTKPATEATLKFLKPLTDIKLISGNAKAINNLLAQFKATGKLPGEEGRIFLLDPLGNIMMTYTKEFVVRDLLKDIEHLLKYSQIG